MFDWRQAERDCAAWLRQIGFEDARTTGGAADGGIDIVGPGVIGQVKATTRTPTGRPDVQQLLGVVTATNRRRPRAEQVRGVLFSMTGFTDEARTFAEGLDELALVSFHPRGEYRFVTGSGDQLGADAPTSFLDDPVAWTHGWLNDRRLGDWDRVEDPTDGVHLRSVTTWEAFGESLSMAHLVHVSNRPAPVPLPLLHELESRRAALDSADELYPSMLMVMARRGFTDEAVAYAKECNEAYLVEGPVALLGFELGRVRSWTELGQTWLASQHPAFERSVATPTWASDEFSWLEQALNWTQEQREAAKDRHGLERTVEVEVALEFEAGNAVVPAHLSWSASHIGGSPWLHASLTWRAEDDIGPVWWHVLEAAGIHRPSWAAVDESSLGWSSEEEPDRAAPHRSAFDRGLATMENLGVVLEDMSPVFRFGTEWVADPPALPK